MNHTEQGSMLDQGKGKEKLEFDLVNVTADELPEGVEFERATRKGNDWILTFSAKILKWTCVFNSRHKSKIDIIFDFMYKKLFYDLLNLIFMLIFFW